MTRTNLGTKGKEIKGLRFFHRKENNNPELVIFDQMVGGQKKWKRESDSKKVFWFGGAEVLKDFKGKQNEIM